MSSEGHFIFWKDEYPLEEEFCNSLFVKCKSIWPCCENGCGNFNSHAWLLVQILHESLTLHVSKVDFNRFKCCCYLAKYVLTFQDGVGPKIENPVT